STSVWLARLATKTLAPKVSIPSACCSGYHIGSSDSPSETRGSEVIGLAVHRATRRSLGGRDVDATVGGHSRRLAHTSVPLSVKAGWQTGRSAGRRGCQGGEHRGLLLQRLLVAVEGIAVGQLAGVEVADMRPVGVVPDQHSQRQLDADAGVGLHQRGA